jgi:hypothetical protein
MVANCTSTCHAHGMPGQGSHQDRSLMCATCHTSINPTVPTTGACELNLTTYPIGGASTHLNGTVNF